MKTVQGHGAKELLKVGGKLPGPGASLRFNVPQATLMECRDGETVFARRVGLHSLSFDRHWGSDGSLVSSPRPAQQQATLRNPKEL